MRSPPVTLFAACPSYVQCEEHELGGVKTPDIGLVRVVRGLAVELIVNGIE